GLVDGLVTHVPARPIRVLGAQPGRDLLRAPLQLEGVSDGLCKRSGPSTGRLVLARGRGPIRMTDQKPASESKSTRVPEALGTGLDAEIDRIIERAQAEGLQLTGKEGLLGGMIKNAVGSAMNAEMTAHLGYEKYAVAGRGSGNSRNGTTTSTVHTTAGPVKLDKPR